MNTQTAPTAQPAPSMKERAVQETTSRVEALSVKIEKLNAAHQRLQYELQMYRTVLRVGESFEVIKEAEGRLIAAEAECSRLAALIVAE